MVRKLGNKTFEEFIKKHKVVVEFFASWCTQCKILRPRFEKVAEQYSDIKFGKLSVENYAQIASDYNISSVPSMVFFQNGNVVAVETGALTISELKQKIKVNFNG